MDFVVLLILKWNVVDFHAKKNCSICSRISPKKPPTNPALYIFKMSAAVQWNLQFKYMQMNHKKKYV